MSTVIGTELRNLRKFRNHSLNTVSKKIGCSVLILSKIESGKELPKTDLLKSLSKFYKLNEEFLFERLDFPLPEKEKR